MDKVVAWGRGLACVLTLASLAACNSDHSSSTSSAQSAGTTGNDTPTHSQAANAAPEVEGTPGSQAVVGQTYSFTPTATDADGDGLSYSISGKPGWASFNASTGKLSGAPSNADVGSYEDIIISVSDGQNTSSLAQFTINVVQQADGNVTLSWQAPTQNTDGSPLTNLEGYRIHYGMESGNYTTAVTLSNAGLTRYVIENLASGTYYFAISAVSASGAESDLSGEASKTI